MRNVLAVLGISFFLAVSAPTYADAQSSSETYRQLDLSARCSIGCAPTMSTRSTTRN